MIISIRQTFSLSDSPNVLTYSSNGAVSEQALKSYAGDLGSGSNGDCLDRFSIIVL